MIPTYGTATQRGPAARSNQYRRKTIMAQIAKTEAEKATDNVAELGKRTADKAVDATREGANGAEDTARRGFQAAQKTAGAALEVERAVVRQSAEGATEVGEVFAKLAKEQAQNNVETFQALTRTIDWSQVAQIHGDFLRASVERAAEFTKRYFEVVQAVVASAAATAKEQVRKTA
jgi:Phasin protein